MKIQYIKFIDHPRFGTQSVRFSASGKLEQSVPYVTIILGHNGTGKSTLLREFLECLMHIYYRKDIRNELRRRPKYKFEIAYYTSNNFYIVGFNGHDFYRDYFGDKIPLTDSSAADAIPLGTNIIASAHTVYDKFPVKDIRSITRSKFKTNQASYWDTSFYEYMGIKSRNNMANSSSHIYRTLDFMFDAYHEQKEEHVRRIFEHLGFKPMISIRFRFNRIKYFHENRINKTSFKGLFTDKNEELYRLNLNVWQSIKGDDDLINDIVDYLRKYYNEDLFGGNTLGTRDFEMSLDFNRNSREEKVVKEYRIISVLRRLDILRYKNVYVKKDDESRFDLRTASSGELSFLTSFLSISATISEESIILIDEPEISLHPNWQIKYIDILYELFENYPLCHFIIATHSHFLVSDLRGSNSSIVHINSKDGILKAELLDIETFGRSAEEVLYNIFGVVTNRNHYFELELRRLLNLINSQSLDFDKINGLVEKFESFNLNEDDPLQIILKKAKEYTENGD
jgi:predicted ATPase